jgi:hypothetical protein
MTTLMTAPYRTIALDRRMLAVHAKPSAHRTPATQGGLGTPLTRRVHSLDERIAVSPPSPPKDPTPLAAMDHHLKTPEGKKRIHPARDAWAHSTRDARFQSV